MSQERKALIRVLKSNLRFYETNLQHPYTVCHLLKVEAIVNQLLTIERSKHVPKSIGDTASTQGSAPVPPAATSGK